MKIFRYFAFLFTFPFIGLLSVKADAIKGFYSYGAINGVDVFLSGMDEGNYSNYKMINAGNEFNLKIDIDTFYGISANYITVVTYCSTNNYPAILLTPHIDVSQGKLIANYSTNASLGTCSVSQYTGSLHQAVVAISKLNGYEMYSFKLWAGASVNYNSFVQITDISTYEYTPELENSFREKINSNTIIDQNNALINKSDETNSKLDEAENTRKGIWGTIKDVLSNIIALPKKIVEFLVDALKDLFIPTEEQISEVIDDSKELSENFGFIGEGVSFSVQLFTSLLNIGQSTGCVDFPEFSLDFTNVDSIGHKVKFWEKSSVCLADNAWFGTGSNGIVVVRSVTTILCIVVFLNFCYRAFFRVLSKESVD